MLPSPDTTFQVANTAALLGWIVLFASPPSARWAGIGRRFAGVVLPTALAILYVVLIPLHWSGDGGFGSLAEVRALFQVPGLLLAGWVHYLAVDLLVGGWIARRGAELGVPHWLLVPVLLLTFLFGPAGWLAFVVLCAVRRVSVLNPSPGASQ
jgi:hypothetical protein